MSRITCFRCDKNGHFAAECPDRLLKLQETYENKVDETHEADKLLMHEVVYLNENTIRLKEFETNIDGDRLWYLDNGASNHMTGNRKYFKAIDETITGKVRFGDDSKIDIKGKGSILFESQDGDKKILADVYFIPELKSNIISLGQATESGCEVLMKDDVLTLRDKDGKLITSAKRSPNRLYKVLMEMVEVKCLYSKVQDNGRRWHARLGHIGTDSLQLMVKKELVRGIPKINIRKEPCEACMRGKQARQVFPQATTLEQLRD